MILSTGMATLAEIENALAVIAFGLLYGNNKAPTQKAFLSAYASSEGQKLLKNMLLYFIVRQSIQLNIQKRT